MITDEDLLREEMILDRQLRFMSERDPDARKRLWDEMALLMRGRSAEQVERMERARGLR